MISWFVWRKPCFQQPMNACLTPVYRGYRMEMPLNWIDKFKNIGTVCHCWNFYFKAQNMNRLCKKPITLAFHRFSGHLANIQPFPERRIPFFRVGTEKRHAKLKISLKCWRFLPIRPCNLASGGHKRPGGKRRGPE